MTEKDLLEALRCLPGDPAHVALVGHNPGLTDLYNALVDTPIDNLPTFGVAHIALAIPSFEAIEGSRAGHATLLLPKELLRDE